MLVAVHGKQKPEKTECERVSALAALAATLKVWIDKQQATSTNSDPRMIRRLMKPTQTPSAKSYVI